MAAMTAAMNQVDRPYATAPAAPTRAGGDLV